MTRPTRVNRVAEVIHGLALVVLVLSLLAIVGTGLVWAMSGSDTPFYLALLAFFAAAALARYANPYRRDRSIVRSRKSR